MASYQERGTQWRTGACAEIKDFSGSRRHRDGPRRTRYRLRRPKSSKALRRARSVDVPTVLLVASSGGHLLELLELAGQYERHRRHWVTFDKPDARTLLTGESVTFAYGPTNRHIGNLLRNAVLAFRVIFRLQPGAVITTGAGVGVPFLYAARALGKRAIYVESLARIEALSLSGRMVYPVATDLFVQWPELAERYRKCRYAGAIV